MKRNLARSVRLFRAFLAEQTDPARFYGALAEDSRDILAEHCPLSGARMLDVGAGPEDFARVFRDAGVRYVPLDRDAHVESVRSGVVGDAAALPFSDDAFDIVFSSNLLEHVPHPWAVSEELLRVLAPGGVLFLSYTNWLSPWGGHETSPWHWLGGEYAVRRYTRRAGHGPKNRVDESLFRLSVKDGVAWAGRHETEVLDVRPRYWPDVARLLLRVPGLREIATWNLLILVRKTAVSKADSPEIVARSRRNA